MHLASYSLLPLPTSSLSDGAIENIGLRKRSQAVIEPVGRSAVMQRLREQVKRLAQHDTWVLISGEPGSGRETFARYLHAQSVRRDRPFVEVAVNTIAPGNAARDLFGSETDGHIHYGRLEQASGGTLFLDEIADMDAEAQRQLVGALDTGSFVRVSGSDPVKIDVRIIAATSRELAAEVQAKRFREDLFYQLNVVPLRIPPLREHHEDTPDLLSFYVDYFAQHEKLPYRRFSVGAQNFLRKKSTKLSWRRRKLFIVQHRSEILFSVCIDSRGFTKTANWLWRQNSSANRTVYPRWSLFFFWRTRKRI